MDEPSWRDLAPSAAATFQFGIRDLLIAQAVCAACFGLFAMIGVFALLAIFVATLLLCAIDIEFEPTRFRRCLIDLMAGVVLPALSIVCFFPAPDDESAVVSVITVAFQMLTLLVWMIVARRWNGGKAVFAGILAVGVAMLGVAVLPFFFLGMVALWLYGPGVLCFVPLLTCCVFVRNLGEAIRGARAVQGKWTVAALFLLGIILALAIPPLVCAVAGPWIETALMAVWPQEYLWRTIPWLK
jgi:hypothetical protein